MNNTKLIKALTLALALGAPFALAEQPENPGGDHTCQGGHNCNDGGGTGGTQTQTQELNNEVYQGTYVGVESDSNSAAESSSNSGSYSNSSGGSVRNSNYIQGGRSDASSEAHGGNATGGDGGDSTSRVGDTTSVSEGGKSQASSGGNIQDISVEGDTLTDNSVLTYEDSENSAASAASVFAGYCQTGASGSMRAGGFSVTNPEAYCNHVRQAAVAREAYEWEMKNGSASCAEPMSIDHKYNGAVFADTCVNEQAAEYLAMYHDNLSDADDLLQSTNAVGKVDAFAGYLIRPLAILALLILL